MPVLNREDAADVED